MGHLKRAAEIKERAAENFSVLKSAPAKACSKKCTAGSKVRGVREGQNIAQNGPRFWKIMLQFFFITDMVAYMQGGMRAR